MRVAILLVGLLLLAGWVACVCPEPADCRVEPQDVDSWRRTIDGWELTSSWQPSPHFEPPVPHPVVIGMLQALVAGAIGVAAQPVDGRAGHSPKHSPSRENA